MIQHHPHSLRSRRRRMWLHLGPGDFQSLQVALTTSTAAISHAFGAVPSEDHQAWVLQSLLGEEQTLKLYAEATDVVLLVHWDWLPGQWVVADHEDVRVPPH